MTISAHISANVERFMGFADIYDAFRPRPPLALLDLLTQLADVLRPALVVDIGSGTGLSTVVWAGRAATVIGIEPSPDMRAQAEQRVAGVADPASVRYQAGYGYATGLPDACADIVTCSQSLHWMEPEPTFAEIGRILRPGGVFAAYDCDWPPTVTWAIEQAHQAFLAQLRVAEQKHGFARDVRAWDKRQHLQRMRESGQFRLTKEVVLHHVEQGGADRLIGLELSQGGVATLIKNGVSEDEIGVSALREAARAALGDTIVPWYFSYRMRVGVR